jgi:uncharacterized membrane protein (UPF0127 family)
VRAITIIAIVAAAAAGIIAGAILYVNPLTENQQQELVAIGTKPSNNGYRQANITINGIELVADIAETNDQRTVGLAVKDTLNENEAMLFVFSTEREHSFWMKNMKFPIDIIWLDADKEVVHIEHSLDPCLPDSSCQTYKPNDNSLYVLETVAGFAQKYKVTEGTVVEFELD